MQCTSKPCERLTVTIQNKLHALYNIYSIRVYWVDIAFFVVQVFTVFTWFTVYMCLQFVCIALFTVHCTVVHYTGCTLHSTVHIALLTLQGVTDIITRKDTSALVRKEFVLMENSTC